MDLEIAGLGGTAKVYRDGGTAIKLYENAPHDEAENEAKRQSFAVEAGLPVPAVYGVRRIDEQKVALEMAYIGGQPLLQPEMDWDEQRKAICLLVELQCKVHMVSAHGEPSQTLRLAYRIKHCHILDDARKERLLARLEQLDDGAECLCHGDFHPLNILYDGTTHWIIDWVDATAGSPLADACRTYIIFLEHMERAAGIYLEEYCKAANAAPKEVLAWLPVIAAARLSENLGEKTQTWLFEILDKH